MVRGRLRAGVLPAPTHQPTPNSEVLQNPRFSRLPESLRKILTVFEPSNWKCPSVGCLLTCNLPSRPAIYIALAHWWIEKEGVASDGETPFERKEACHESSDGVLCSQRQNHPTVGGESSAATAAALLYKVRLCLATCQPNCFATIPTMWLTRCEAIWLTRR
jgi:hypothetical protein